MIYLIAGLAALAGFLFGFDEGIIAGILPVLHNHFHLTNASEGFLASALPLGALVASIILGSYIATKLTSIVGRRSAILATAVLFFISALAAAFAPNLSTLIIARIITGLAIGLAGVMTPLYIAEMAPAAVRGRLVSAYQLAITVGILVGYMINYVFTYNWRTMFALGAIPAIILFFSMLFLPESARWLVLTNKINRAKKVLTDLHTTENVDQALEEIHSTIEHEGNMVRWSELFTPMVRPALIVAMMLFVLQQLSGINVIIYFAPSIFASAGFSSQEVTLLGTVGLGLVNMLTTIAAMWLIEKIGRRGLLFIGFTGCAVTLALIGLCMHAQAADMGKATFILTMLYIIAFAISLGPIPFVIMSEVFPIHVRNTGMGLASMCNWGFNFIVVFTFPIMVHGIGISTTFYIYALFCVFGLLFTYYFVPETKGATLEQITEYLLHRKPLRNLGE